MGLEGLQAISAISSIGSSVASVTRSVAPLAQGAMGVAGNIVAGRGGQQTAEFNAQVAELEAGLALQSATRSDLNAQIARNAAGIEVSRTLEAGRRIQGTQAAQAAHAGLVVTEGSPILVQLETLRRSEEDAILARWKGDVAATGLEADAAQKRIQAEALRTRAQMQRVAGRRTFLGGLLGAGEAGIRGLTEYQKIQALKGTVPGDVQYPTLFPSNLRAGEYAGYGYD